MAVASGVLAVVVVEDHDGFVRRVPISARTRCDLELIDRLLRLQRAARSFGTTVRLEQVQPVLTELLDFVGLLDRFRQNERRGNDPR